MAATWHGAFVVGLVSAGVGVPQAAQRLIDEGISTEELSEIEEFVRELDLDPSARDRTRLLVERTRMLIEGATVGEETSARLRAHQQTQPPEGAAVGDVGSLWRHELSTPLAVTSMALQTLATHLDDPTMVQRMVEVGQRNLRLALHLMQDLSSVEDLQAGRVELSWGPVDLVALVRECADDIRVVLVGDHEIEVVADQPVEVPGDRDALHQVLTNLLSNAAKFSPDGSPIQVTVSATPEYTEVGIRDHGPGLSPQDEDRIFEAGQRLDPQTSGMGLGLFVARQLARAHGGGLHLQRPDAGGCRFVLRLPTSPHEWQVSLEQREAAVSAREVGQDDEAATAHARDVTLSQREGIADQRDATLTEREAIADEREAELDRREDA